MGRTALVGLVCVALAWPACSPLAAPIQWPAVPVPPSTQMSKVGDELRVNGLPMRTMAFESSLQPAEIIRFYISQWRGSGAASGEKQVNGWTVVAHSLAPFHTTVQVRAQGKGSMGYVGTTALGLEGRDAPQPDFSTHGVPQPPGFRVMSSVVSTDGGKHGVVVTLSGPMSVTATAAYYATALARQKWHGRDDAGGKAGGGVDRIYRVYDRGREQLDIAFVREPRSGETHVHANLVRPGG